MNVKELLNFNFDFDNLQKSIEFTLSKSLLSKQERLIREIEEMNTNLVYQGTGEVSNLIDVFLLYKQGYNENSLSVLFDNVFKARRLSYCFSLRQDSQDMILSNKDETLKALEILQEFWKPSFLIGLFKSLVFTWDHIDIDAASHLRRFIKNKLEADSGNKKYMLSIKNNFRFFEDQNGPSLLGLELAYKQVPLDKIIEYLKLPRFYIEADYFCKVIATYIEKSLFRQTELFEQVIEFLNVHKSQSTLKRLMSKMIIRLDVNPDNDVQLKVREFVNKRIGDTDIDSNWYAPDSFTNKEKQELQQARDILNKWITAQFIEVFFKVCIDDKRRKDFWLKQVKYVSKFKIYGPQRFYDELILDQRISKYLKSRYVVVSHGTASAAAIVMFINHHVLIEFSQENHALYVYKQGSSNCPIFNYRIASIRDLKQTYLSMIPFNERAWSQSFYDEGRFSHRDDWESIFEQYIKKVII